MGTRGGETRDMGNTGLTVLPPPERCVRTPSNGRGGWALWRPQGTRRQDRTGGLQGGARSGTHGGAGSSGGHGGAGSSGGHGGSGNSGGHGGSGSLGGHGGTASETAAPAPASVSLAGALLPPQKISMGKIGATSGTWGRTGGADSWGCSGNTLTLFSKHRDRGRHSTHTK